MLNAYKENKTSRKLEYVFLTAMKRSRVSVEDLGKLFWGSGYSSGEDKLSSRELDRIFQTQVISTKIQSRGRKWQSCNGCRVVTEITACSKTKILIERHYFTLCKSYLAKIEESWILKQLLPYSNFKYLFHIFHIHNFTVQIVWKLPGV